MSKAKLVEKSVLVALGIPLVVLYWFLVQILRFSDSWVPAVFFLLMYGVILTKGLGLTIKAGPGGVEISSIGEKASKGETERGFDERRRLHTGGVLFKNDYERLTLQQKRQIRGKTEYVAVYRKSPLHKVIDISRLAGYNYFPVIWNDDTAQLMGVVTLCQIRKYVGLQEDRLNKKILNLLARRKPAIRAYSKEPDEEVLIRMLENNLTKIPIVDESNRLKGVVKLSDLRGIMS